MKMIAAIALLSISILACTSMPKQTEADAAREPAGFDAASILYPYKYANKNTPPVITPPAGFSGEVLDGTQGLKIISWTKKSAKKNSLTVIYIHGNGESLSALTSNQKMEWLISKDINFVDYDYPKYGYSEGELNEKSMTEAAKLVFDSTLKDFPDSDLFIIGRSLGTGVLMQLLAQPDVQTHLKGIVLISPWTSVEELGKTTHPMLAKFLSAGGNEYKSLDVAPTVQMPTLILHGTADKTIPSALGEKLAAAFPPKNIEIQLLQGLDHDQMLQSPQLHESVLKFIGLAQ